MNTIFSRRPTAEQRERFYQIKPREDLDIKVYAAENAGELPGLKRAPSTPGYSAGQQGQQLTLPHCSEYRSKS
jgi:hypothetical protein